MKLNAILTEAPDRDLKRAEMAYSGRLAGKEIARDLKLGKFLGKDEYDEYVVYEGDYYVGEVEVQTDSWVTHPETRQDPAEYGTNTDDIDIGFEGKFYYSYDPEEDQPHYWKFDGELYMDGGSVVDSDHEYEGVGITWNEAVKQLLNGMASQAENVAQDVYDRNKGWD